MNNEALKLTFCNDAKILFNEGMQCFSVNNFNDAEKYFLAALESVPNSFQIFFQLSRIYYLKKDFHKAEFYLIKVIDLQSNVPEFYSVLGIVQKELGKQKEAEINYLQAIAINPNFSEAYYNLGILLYNQKRFEESVYYFSKSVELNPNFHLAYFNLGNSLRQTKKYSDAIAYYKKAIEIKSNFDDAYYNLGVVCEKLYDAENAFLNYEKAININPQHCYAHWNRSLLLLLKEDFINGFQEYEWRKYRDEYPKRNFKNLELTKKNISKKIIYIYDDQGLGDTIQFARYIKLLKELDNVIVFECDINLFPLFEKSKYIDFLVERNSNNEINIDYDYHISLLSLPFYFNTTLESIPEETSCFKADDELKIYWQKLIKQNENLKVGLVWGGNPNHERDDERSINLELFNPLFELNDVKYFSLQKSNSDKIENELKSNSKLIKPKINSFADTAALIENLDLIISVDTSVAHLAGAMEKEVWTLLHYYPDWRWMLNRNDSPWYKSMRLFRQSKNCSWQEVIENVKSELQKKIHI